MNVRIIDLLSLESRGMELPTKIRVFGQTFIYTGDKRPPRMYKMENQDNYLLRDFVYTLNTEVEVLEEGETEEKKIPEKIDVWYDPIKDTKLERHDTDTSIEILANMCNDLKDKYNGIIDYLQSKGDE